MYLAKNEDFKPDLVFSKEELNVIYGALDACVKGLSLKKFHKTKNDILVENKLKNINKKIKNYLEV